MMMAVCQGKDQEGMDHDDPPQLSLLQRLDRLDYLMQALEERHCCSSRHSSPSIRMVNGREDGEGNHPAKNVSTVLEEVQSKGTLIERVAILEDRLLQLNLEIEASNVSKSSSSVAAAEKVPPELESSASDVLVAVPVKNHKEKPQQPLPTQVRRDNTVIGSRIQLPAVTSSLNAIIHSKNENKLLPVPKFSVDSIGHGGWRGMHYEEIKEKETGKKMVNFQCQEIELL